MPKDKYRNLSATVRFGLNYNNQMCRVVEEHVLNKLGWSAKLHPTLVVVNRAFMNLYNVEKAVEWIDRYVYFTS